MSRHYLYLIGTVVLAFANAALFLWQGYALCVLAAIAFALAALEINDRLSARP